MSAPPGWYPTDQGLRFWDGTQWAALPAPPPSPVTPAVPQGPWPAGPAHVGGADPTFTTPGGGRRKPGWKAWLGAGGAIAVVLAIGAALGDREGASPSTNVPRETTGAMGRATPSDVAPTGAPTKVVGAPGTALAAVSLLSVKGRAPKAGYDRAAFGGVWSDVDGNGCDTRNDILRRDLKDVTVTAGTDGCRVLSGSAVSPYSGQVITLTEAQGRAATIEVDHVVALVDAWQKGAQDLSLNARTALANDPLNLLVVDGATNAAKGGGDAATWLPPLKPARCGYVARQIAVKLKYHLWMAPAERDAVVRILASCPTERLPNATTVPRLGGLPEVTPEPDPTQPPAPPPADAGGQDPRFDTCRAAKAAGYGPYRSGADPEYEWYRDADHDGVVCE